jgi:hypothetical protein
LAESDRLKFLQLAPASNSSVSAVTPRLSPDLQRTLLLAMARELGWLTPAEIESLRNGSQSTATNRTGVDFVDLRPAASGAPTSPKVQKADGQIADAGTSPPAASTLVSGGIIPAFVSGDSMVVAIDSSVAPTGSSVTFWVGVPGQAQQPMGTTVLGENPTAVTIPFASRSADGLNLIITAGTVAGGSNVIGQFFAPPASHP